MRPGGRSDGREKNGGKVERGAGLVKKDRETPYAGNAGGAGGPSGEEETTNDLPPPPPPRTGRSPPSNSPQARILLEVSGQPVGAPAGGVAREGRRFVNFRSTAKGHLGVRATYQRMAVTALSSWPPVSTFTSSMLATCAASGGQRAGRSARTPWREEGPLVKTGTDAPPPGKCSPR